ncbi:hypothetical protein MYP_273 [Sporocytophaga myxococcoides]|uniref:Uncharacterized protein n=1 Tax=Sporocytophaga myxococcoides TaxID=153721 RepID=A0A098L8Y6_9BACT|nr:hypothetical protein [Sporocytophaga myxococcoides]GAL83047.1 hypothetical protein MYP_273 [Sporocytophaga myxococcoides]
MKIKLKNIIISGFIAALILPFILITDLFPFARFGMFAEPVSSADTLKIFEAEFYQNHQWHNLNAKQFNMASGSFMYLARNYYYRNQSQEFLNKLSQAIPDTSIYAWRLKFIQISGNNPQQADTIIIETLIIR